MDGTSEIRKRFRSKALKQLIRERTPKRLRKEADDEIESDQESDQESQQTLVDNKRNSSLLSILPKPKNSNAFGPTVNIERLLKNSQQSDNVSNTVDTFDETSPDQDGVVEFDVSRIMTDPVIKPNLAVEQQSKVVVPKGKEKQKNQITYLAQLSKATELERKEQAALGRFNKRAARAKYGWWKRRMEKYVMALSACMSAGAFNVLVIYQWK